MVDLLLVELNKKKNPRDLVKKGGSSVFISADFFSSVNGELWIASAPLEENALFYVHPVTMRAFSSNDDASLTA
jgi:hypothetical protein